MRTPFKVAFAAVMLVATVGAIELPSKKTLNLAAAKQIPAAAEAEAVGRTSDGKPDLSGFWQVLNTAEWDIQDHHAQKGTPAGQGVVEGNEIPYQPWAAEKRKRTLQIVRLPTLKRNAICRACLGSLTLLIHFRSFKLLNR
jgi:hypothetical protein